MALCTLSDVRQHLAIIDAGDDDELDLARQAASDAVHNYVGFGFELDAAPSAKVFAATGRTLLDLAACGLTVGTSTGLAVATDEDDDGAYETVWLAADWQLEPLNGIGPGGVAWPGLVLRAVGDQRFPVGGSGRARVQVTARWGWPSVPSRVKLAAIMLTAAWHQRRATLTGRSGFDGFFASAIADDSTIQDLLDPFRAGTTMVGMA